MKIQQNNLGNKTIKKKGFNIYMWNYVDWVGNMGEEEK